MPSVLQLRRGTTSQNNAFTGAIGELSYDTSVDTIRVHDGSTAGGFAITSDAGTSTLTNKTLTSPIINTGTFGTSILPVSADGTTIGSASKEFSDLFLADAGTIQLGNDQDVTITHVEDTGILLNGSSKIQFTNAAESIHSDGSKLILTSNSVAFELPSADGSAGQFLKTNGSAVLSFDTVSSAADDISAGDAAVTISTSSGNITIDAAANDSDFIVKGTDGGADITMATFSGADAGTLILNHDLELGTDGSIVKFGANNEILLTHVHDVGLLLTDSGGGPTLQLTDANESISSDGSNLILTSGGTAFTIPASDGSANQVLATNGSGVLSFANASANTPSSADGQALGSASLEWSDLFLADGGTVTFGNDQDIVLTHVADTGLTLSHAATADNKPVVFQLKSSEAIVVADEVIASIEFAATDSDGTDGAGVAAGIHAIAEGTFSASANATKLAFTCGVSETAAASATAKMTLSSAGLLTVVDDIVLKSGGTIGGANDTDLLTIGNAALTVAGTLAATTGTFSGILKTDDTTEATSTTDGSLQTDGGLSVAKDIIAGDDVKLLSDSAVLSFGADSDTTLTHTDGTGLTLNSTNKLCFNDATQFIQGASGTVLDIAATDEIELTATLIDVVGNLAGSGTGTFGGILKTDDTTAATSTTDGSLQTDGGLSVAGDAVIGDDILLLSDAAVIKFGANSDVTLTHVADAGLTLSVPATADNSFPTLNLSAGDNDIAVNDVLGEISFQAPAEGAGTDAILVAAGIAAISEGNFAADNNATKLVFKTAASAAAAETAALSSIGDFSVAGDLVIKDGGLIGSASDLDAIAIAANGVVTFSQAITGQASSALYADLAEMYDSDETIPEGTVVMFAGEGKLKACDTANCTRVAGIVSTDPAYLMNSSQEGVALALAGRVPCKVTGPVQAGDLMVSAGNGLAKAYDADIGQPLMGSVIGKAIEDHAEEEGVEGVIEVLAMMM